MTTQKWSFLHIFPCEFGAAATDLTGKEAILLLVALVICAEGSQLLKGEQELVPSCVSSAEVNNIYASLLCKPESN